MTLIEEKTHSTPNYSGKLQFIEEGGEVNLLLHLEVGNWSKEVLQELRQDLDSIIDLAGLYDIQSVSFVVPYEVGTKFHKLIKPLDYEIEEERGIVGGWFTEV